MTLIISALIFLVPGCIHVTISQPEVNVQAAVEQVTETYLVRFTTLTLLDVTIQFGLNQFDAGKLGLGPSGTPVTADQIRQAYSGMTLRKQQELRNAINSAVRDTINATLTAQFRLYVPDMRPEIVDASLQPDATGAILIGWHGSISLDTSFYNFSSAIRPNNRWSLNELMLAFLRMDGRLNISMLQRVMVGHKQTINLFAAPETVFRSEGKEARENTNPIEWFVDNSAGDKNITQRYLEIRAAELHPPYPYTSSKIQLDISVDFYGFSFTSHDQYLLGYINATMSIYHTRLPTTIQHALPESVSLNYIDSDGIRLMYQSGLVSQTDIHKMIVDYKSTVSRYYLAIFKQELNLSIAVHGLNDAVDIEQTSDARPIVLEMQTELKHSLSEQHKSAAVTRWNENIVLREILYELAVPLFSIPEYTVNYKFKFPKGVEVRTVDMSEHQPYISVDKDERYFFTVSFVENSSNRDDAIIGIRIKIEIDLESLRPLLFVIAILVGLWLIIVIYSSIIKKRRKRTG